MAPSRSFVLLHGAWHGGWCWEWVAEILRARGHKVTTPTQTGLAERRHLLSPDITLETFVEDVTNHLLFEDLSDVVLVGHSFGGCAITGAADRLPDRISSLIYLDSALPRSGKTPFDAFAPDVVAARIAAAEKTPKGLLLPPPSAEALGIVDETQAAWVMPRLTPHPLSTYQTAISYEGVPGGGKWASYIVCTDPLYAALDGSREYARECGMAVHELATGHDAMVSAPRALADLLERLA